MIQYCSINMYATIIIMIISSWLLTHSHQIACSMVWYINKFTFWQCIQWSVCTAVGLVAVIMLFLRVMCSCSHLKNNWSSRASSDKLERKHISEKKSVSLTCSCSLPLFPSLPSPLSLSDTHKHTHTHTHTHTHLHKQIHANTGYQLEYSEVDVMLHYDLSDGRQWKKRVWTRKSYPKQLFRWNTAEVCAFAWYAVFCMKWSLLVFAFCGHQFLEVMATCILNKLPL